MTENLPKNVQKYIDKFALKKWDLFYKSDSKFNTIIVIPIISEFENIKILISSLFENDSKYFSETLVLFVVNNLKSTVHEIKNDNAKTIKYLENIIAEKRNGLSINFIDASSDNLELDEKDGGVGLARKIGMDLALTLFNYKSNHSNVIVCLDGDCIVEKNYISTIREYFNQNKVSAGYVNFKHLETNDEENEKAIVNYELFLRYYILGLTFAKSPYAYHSIGSTMICDAESYIKVQGMNKRKAAEDFYFMEKLSKITPIKKISGTYVIPSSRGSWRVPFGTGQRVNRFLDKVQNEYTLYSPKSFEILKEWNTLFFSSAILSSQEYLEKAKIINTHLYEFLVDSSFEKNWEKIVNNSSSNSQIQNQKKLWFDGFRTLKLIHFLRDKSYPSINMFDAIDALFAKMQINFAFQNHLNQIPNLEIQKKYLEKLREVA